MARVGASVRGPALALIAAWCIGAVAPPAAAQSSDAYSRISLRFAGVVPTSIGSLARLYTSATGFAASVEVPAEFGSLAVGVRRQEFHHRAGGPAPDFRATIHALDWRSPALRARRLSLSAGVSVADFDMSFADSVIVEGLRDERELMVGATGRVALALTPRWTVSADAAASRIMLHEPVYMTTVGAGVAWSMRAPTWLREFLR